MNYEIKEAKKVFHIIVKGLFTGYISRFNSDFILKLLAILLFHRIGSFHNKIFSNQFNIYAYNIFYSSESIPLNFSEFWPEFTPLYLSFIPQRVVESIYMKDRVNLST